MWERFFLYFRQQNQMVGRRARNTRGCFADEINIAGWRCHFGQRQLGSRQFRGFSFLPESRTSTLTDESLFLIYARSFHFLCFIATLFSIYSFDANSVGRPRVPIFSSSTRGQLHSRTRGTHLHEKIWTDQCSKKFVLFTTILNAA